MSAQWTNNTSLFETFLMPLVGQQQKLAVLKCMDVLTQKVVVYRTCAVLQKCAELSKQDTGDAVGKGWMKQCTEVLDKLSVVFRATSTSLEEQNYSASDPPFRIFEFWKLLDVLGTLLGSTNRTSDSPSRRRLFRSFGRCWILALSSTTVLDWMFPTLANGVPYWLTRWSSVVGIEPVRSVPKMQERQSVALGLLDILALSDDESADIFADPRQLVLITLAQYAAVKLARKLESRTEVEEVSRVASIVSNMLSMMDSRWGEQAVTSALGLYDGVSLIIDCAMRLPGHSEFTETDVEVALELLTRVIAVSRDTRIHRTVADAVARSGRENSLPAEVWMAIDPVVIYSDSGLAGLLPTLNRYVHSVPADVDRLPYLSSALQVLIEACGSGTEDLAQLIAYVDDQELVTTRGTTAEMSLMSVLVELLNNVKGQLARNRMQLDAARGGSESMETLESDPVIYSHSLIIDKQKLIRLLGRCITLLRKLTRAYDVSVYPVLRSTHTRLPPVVRIQQQVPQGAQSRDGAFESLPVLVDVEEAAERPGRYDANARPLGPLFGLPAMCLSLLHDLTGGVSERHESVEEQMAVQDVKSMLQDLVTAVVLPIGTDDGLSGGLVVTVTESTTVTVVPRLMLPLVATLRTLIDSVLHVDPSWMITILGLLSELLPSGSDDRLIVCSRPEDESRSRNFGEPGSLNMLTQQYWLKALTPLRADFCKILRLVGATSSRPLLDIAITCFERLMALTPDPAAATAGGERGGGSDLTRGLVSVALEDVRESHKMDSIAGDDGDKISRYRDATAQRLYLLSSLTRPGTPGAKVLYALESERGGVSDMLGEIVATFGATEDGMEISRLGQEMIENLRYADDVKREALGLNRSGLDAASEMLLGPENGPTPATVIRQPTAERPGDVETDAGAQMDAGSSQAAEIFARTTDLPFRMPDANPLPVLASLLPAFQFNASLPTSAIPTPSVLHAAGFGPGSDGSDTGTLAVQPTTSPGSAIIPVVSTPTTTGGYRQYTKDEFRSAHWSIAGSGGSIGGGVGVGSSGTTYATTTNLKRKMNASRPPSVHVDRFGRTATMNPLVPIMAPPIPFMRPVVAPPASAATWWGREWVEWDGGGAGDGGAAVMDPTAGYMSLQHPHHQFQQQQQQQMWSASHQEQQQQQRQHQQVVSAQHGPPPQPSPFYPSHWWNG
ncbi:hypothetical protein HKX48_008803 [Thoreauomyces humboldtii]|nr:hypothetical protein HKX48_008803 [Thoreauomyces humboldtii]